MFIPSAVGVPPMWGQAPQWWDNTATKPRAFNNAFDDPRWNGATRREYQDGTTTDAMFRALHMVENGKPFLYLQWYVQHDQSEDLQFDRIYVGFKRETAGAPQYIFKVNPYGSTSASFADQVPQDISSFTRTAATGASSDLSGGNPQWLVDHTRAWLVVRGTEVDWVVAMRVPIISSGDINMSSAASGGGINLSGGTFRFFYAIVSDQGQQTGVWPSYWPREENVAQIQITLTGVQNNYPDPQYWDSVTLGSPAGGAGGVSLDPLDVGIKGAGGTLGTDISSIQANNVVARPRNGTGETILAGKIFASFRMANWGANAVWTTWATASGATAWEEIVDGNPAPGNRKNGADINSGQKGEIGFTWTLTTAQRNEFFGPSPTKDPHQCILVTLSAPGTNVDFVNDSVYKNMRFIPTSAFNSSVELNLKALPKPRTRVGIPAVTARTVYLFVKARNMPRKTRLGRPQEPVDLSRVFRPDEPLSRANIVRLREAREAVDMPLSVLPRRTLVDTPEGPVFRIRMPDDGGPGPFEPPEEPPEIPAEPPHLEIPPEPTTINDIVERMPAVTYKAFYSTTRKIDIDGKLVPVIKRMSGFGYLIDQSAPVFGWDLALGGAFQKIGPNIYKTSVQPGTAKLISTRIVGYERAVPTKRVPEIVPGPAGRIQRNIPILRNLPGIGTVVNRVIRRPGGLG